MTHTARTPPARRKPPTLLEALELVDATIRKTSIGTIYADSMTAMVVAEAITAARRRRRRRLVIGPRHDQLSFIS